MESPHEMTGSLDFVDSISTVTFDLESERFQASYDSSRDSPSLAVVAVVATALGKDPLALHPLHSAIDTDALDLLTTESANGRADGDSVSFCYEGLEVTVTNQDVIEAVPIENA